MSTIDTNRQARPPTSPAKEFGFLVSDVARLLRTLIDHKARELGSSRAQWSVLARIRRSEGLSQSELAEVLDIQPITLTRLVDRLCQDGLVERRADPADRRIRRLYLTPVAGPVLDQLALLGGDIMKDVLAGIDGDTLSRLIGQLETIKGNLKTALRALPAHNQAKVS